MKRIILLFVFFILLQMSHSQKIVVNDNDIKLVFEEIKQATKLHYDLWNKDIYGEILLVNPVTREIYANMADADGYLKNDNGIYKAILPKEINFANTSIEWKGMHWAMIMLPLPENKFTKTDLLAHELFHRSQLSLGFKFDFVDNEHLDLKMGRVYFRLEMEALKKAVLSTTTREKKRNLANALIFRKFRNSIYASSAISENILELNEGLAEYTGQTISGRNFEQRREYMISRMNAFMNNPTYVRSFAYITTPMYGWLLSENKKYWNKDITMSSNLTDYFIKSFGINIPANLQSIIETISQQYDGETIMKEETVRAEENAKIVAAFTTKFITQNHINIQLEQMNFAFNPGNIIPLEDKGTVYPNIRLTDVWGVLTVNGGGALISKNWKIVTISKPVKVEGNLISGEGWNLELTDGYQLSEGENGNYFLVRK